MNLKTAENMANATVEVLNEMDTTFKRISNTLAECNRNLAEIQERIKQIREDSK